MLITASHGNKFTSNFHITSLATISVLSINPLLDFPDGSSVFLKKSRSISHFSRSISIVTGYGSGERRSISSRNVIFFPPFHQCVQTGFGAHSARFAPGCKQTVWIWPFISIYCHGQECVLSFPYACSWGGFYLNTLSSLHPNLGTSFRLFKWAYSRYKKNLIFSHAN
jgi:hypothetical protein